MMPPTSGAPCVVRNEDVFELGCSSIRRMVAKRPLTGALRHQTQFVIGPLDGRRGLGRRRSDENFPSGFEELLQPWPRIGQDRRTARRRLEQAAGRAVA